MMPLGLPIMPLELSVSDATFWSIPLVALITILKRSFGDHYIFIAEATDEMI